MAVGPGRFTRKRSSTSATARSPWGGRLQNVAAQDERLHEYHRALHALHLCLDRLGDFCARRLRRGRPQPCASGWAVVVGASAKQYKFTQSTIGLVFTARAPRSSISGLP